MIIPNFLHQREDAKAPVDFAQHIMVYYSSFCARSGRSSMAELQPSKLATRVRFPSPAPEDICGQSGVMAAAADSKSAVREYVRVRVPPLAPNSAERMMAIGGVSEWSMVQPWKGCVGASPPGVRIPPSPPVYGAEVLKGTRKCQEQISIGPNLVSVLPT